MEIKVYQTNNRDYRFEGYDFAKELFNINDYEVVAEFKLDTEDNILNLLSKIYRIGNNGELQQSYKMRSISVSDVVEVDGTKYYVDSYGFKRIGE